MPGQALVVFIPKETYQVRSGDTIYGIARQAGISARELIQRNPSRAQGAPLPVGEQNVVYAGIAQSVEQLIRNQQVACSSHVSSSKRLLIPG